MESTGNHGGPDIGSSGESTHTPPKLGTVKCSNPADCMRLADLAVVYRAAIETPKVSELVFGDVRAARIQGQDRLLEAIAMVLGEHHGSSADDVAARDELLGPILAQNEAIGAAMKARRTVGDVNPEIGALYPSGAAGGMGAPSAEGRDVRVDLRRERSDRGRLRGEGQQ